MIPRTETTFIKKKKKKFNKKRQGRLKNHYIWWEVFKKMEIDYENLDLYKVEK